MIPVDNASIEIVVNSLPIGLCGENSISYTGAKKLQIVIVQNTILFWARVNQCNNIATTCMEATDGQLA